MKTRVNKYFVLLPLLIIGFFLFTGGILEFENEYNQPPEIENVGFSKFHYPGGDLYNLSSIPINKDTYILVHFKRKSYKDENCEYENADAQGLNLDVSIPQLNQKPERYRFYARWSLNLGWGTTVYKINLNAPGNYDLKVTATDNFAGKITTATKTFPFKAIQSNNELVLQPGSYFLSSFSVTCPTTNKTFSASLTSNQNKLVITSDYKATLDVNYKIPGYPLTDYPCLKSEYKINKSGSFSINGNVATISYDNTKIKTDSFSFDQNTINLSYNADDGTKTSFTFKK